MVEIKSPDYYLKRQLSKKEGATRLLPPNKKRFKDDNSYIRYENEYEATNIRLIESLRKNGNTICTATRYFIIRDRLVEHEIVKVVEDKWLGDYFVIQAKGWKR